MKFLISPMLALTLMAGFAHADHAWYHKESSEQRADEDAERQLRMKLMEEQREALRDQKRSRMMQDHRDALLINEMASGRGGVPPPLPGMPPRF